jgi:peptidoglycan/LPS O-acetylase OafA/YrhL
MESEKRLGVVIRTLDAWRGFAALWVVMVHACLSTIATSMPGLRNRPLYAFSLLGGLGVQIFFVVSGYCIANAACVSLSRDSASKRFLWARVRRIYPPYFFASIAAVFVALLARWAVAHHIVRDSVSAQLDIFHKPGLYYLASLTLTQVPLRQPTIIVVFWSLCYEITFYGLVLIAMILARREPRRLLHVLHSITVFSLVFLSVAPKHVPFPLNLWPQFGLGVLVFDLFSAPSMRRRAGWALAVLAGVVLFAVSRNLGGDDFHQGSRVQIVACALFALVLVATRPFDEKIRQFTPVALLSAVGVFSYSLYLTHTLVAGVVLQIGKRMHFTERTFILVFAAQILLAIPSAYLFYCIFERPFLSSRRKIVIQESLPAPAPGPPMTAAAT